MVTDFCYSHHFLWLHSALSIYEPFVELYQKDLQTAIRIINVDTINIEVCCITSKPSITYLKHVINGYYFELDQNDINITICVY